MRARIRELPEQCADAWALTRQMSLPFDTATIRQVAILGMGGSAIGGALLAALAADICAVPISIVGGYDLPAHVQRDALVIASSYSGRTEETLCALAQAETRGCPIVVVTAGKEWATHAAGKGWPVALFDYRASPRAALGYSFTLLLGILCRLGLLPDQSAALEEAIALLRERQEEWLPQRPTAQNPAKLLAQRLAGHLPVVYGAGFLAPVARRWKGQFNENSKGWAFFEQMPELNHNAVLGYTNPRAAGGLMSVVMLRSPADHPRVSIRFDITARILHEHGVPVLSAWARGKGILAQMFSLIFLGDYVSLYLAYLYATDPSPVPEIVFLKESLAKA